MKTNKVTPVMVISILFCLFLFSPLLVNSATITDGESPLAIATRLQNRYDTMESLTFNFIQETRGQLSGRPKKGRGQAFFVNKPKDATTPGKMRWNYSAPDRQVLVSDGINFSMYFASLAQMIVTPAKALERDLTYSFFTGSGNLLNDFTIFPPDNPESSQKNTALIKLIPKARQSQVASIQLWVTSNSLIRRIEILDQFDTLTILNFSDLKVNSLEIHDADFIQNLFSFTPPDDTEIIYQ